MREKGSGRRLFVLIFFSILFCFFCFILGFCFYSSSLQGQMKKLINFESGIKFMIKDRLQNKVISNYWVRFFKSKVVELTGKSLVKGIYKKGGTLLKIPVLPEKFQIYECCSEIEKFCNCTNSVIYSFILPTKFQLNGGFTKVINFSNYENELIKIFYSRLNYKVNDLQSNFFLVYLNDFDFFYRTDSSLNSIGNFLVYSNLLKQMNIQPVSIDFFQIRTFSDDFCGNLFNKNFFNLVKPDTIDLFEFVWHGFESLFYDLKVKVTQIDSELYSTSRNSIFDFSKLYGYDKNKVFFGDSFPIKIVETNLEDAENILIFSDGSVDGLMQFLSLHFKRLIVIDLKKIKNNCRKIGDFFNNFKIRSGIKNFEKVLFFYGVESLKNSKFFKQLSYFY